MHDSIRVEECKRKCRLSHDNSHPTIPFPPFQTPLDLLDQQQSDFQPPSYWLKSDFPLTPFFQLFLALAEKRPSDIDQLCKQMSSSLGSEQKAVFFLINLYLHIFRYLKKAQPRVAICKQIFKLLNGVKNLPEFEFVFNRVLQEVVHPMLEVRDQTSRLHSLLSRHASKSELFLVDSGRKFLLGFCGGESDGIAYKDFRQFMDRYHEESARARDHKTFS